jgi:hypothetical protein
MLYIKLLRMHMPYYDAANHVSVTKTNMINLIRWYWSLATPAVSTQHQVLHSCAEVSAALEVSHRAVQRFQLVQKSPADLHRGPSCSTIWLLYKSNIGASLTHLKNCRCSQEHHRMLMLSLRALWLAAAGPGSIWKYLKLLVKSSRVSGRFAWGLQMNLHLAYSGTT